MKVDRETLLSTLDLVSPGLASHEVIEQTASYIFKKTKSGYVVITFNDETACVQKSPIKIKGAVQANPFRTLLQRMKEEIIDIETDDHKLTIVGKGKKSKLRLEKKITIPLKYLDVPTKWSKLPENFSDGIEYVKECASKDASKATLTCVHITSKFVEAFDNEQYAWFKFKIKKLKKPVLVRATAIKDVKDLAVTEFCVTKAWIHFRNPNGLIFSCRLLHKTYKDCANLRKLKGQRIKLPAGLEEASRRAEVFSADGADDNQIRIDLVSGKLKIHGEGQYGEHDENSKGVSYKGPDLSFMIAPAMLERLMKQQQFDCEVTPKALKVEGTNSIFVTSLNTPAEVKKMRESKNKEKDSDDESR